MLSHEQGLARRNIPRFSSAKAGWLCPIRQLPCHEHVSHWHKELNRELESERKASSGEKKHLHVSRHEEDGVENSVRNDRDQDAPCRQQETVDVHAQNRGVNRAPQRPSVTRLLLVRDVCAKYGKTKQKHVCRVKNRDVSLENEGDSSSCASSQRSYCAEAAHGGVAIPTLQ